MNLAIRDIRHKLSRFLLTAVGIGLLLMIVMGMAGIYQGFTEDALSFLESDQGRSLDRAEGDTRTFCGNIPHPLEPGRSRLCGHGRGRGAGLRHPHHSA